MDNSVIAAEFVRMVWVTVIGLLGGGAAILAAAGVVAQFVAKFAADRAIEQRKGELNKELERLKGELAKETETHKLKLKKQEILYARELDATSAFIKLHHSLRPEVAYPDMDYHDACIDLAGRFSSVEVELKAFVIGHGAAVPDAVRADFDHAMALVAHNKFGEIDDSSISPPINAAGELLELLEKIERKLLASIRD